MLGDSNFLSNMCLFDERTQQRQRESFAQKQNISLPILIIYVLVCLVLGVLGWILSTLDATLAEEQENNSFQR